MKKTIALIMAVLMLVLVCGCGNSTAAETAAEPAETEEAAGTVEAEVEAAEEMTVDYGAFYALYDPDEVVMTVDGNDITWAEYAFGLYSTAYNLEYYMTMYYGMSMDPAMELNDEGYTVNQYLLDSAREYVVQNYAVIKYAESKGVVLSADEESYVAGLPDTDRINYLGEDSTEEEFDALLAQLYLNRATYEKNNRISYIYGILENRIYGENGQNISAEEAVAYLEAAGYMHAIHILIPTVDLSTYEALDDAAVAEAKAQAEELAAELQAITDNDARKAKFYEYMNEYSQDTGLSRYPDGYTFKSGEMVSEFEEAVKSGADYEVSDPVLSSYGYHIIMTLPLDADGIISYDSSTGSPVTIRTTMASEFIDTGISDAAESTEVVFLQEVDKIDLNQFLVPAAVSTEETVE